MRDNAVNSAPHCPVVKALDFYPDGSVKRVEFKMPADLIGAAAPVFFNPAAD